MRHPRISRLRLIGVLSILGIIVVSLPLPVHAETYRLTAFPFYSQEGSTITIVLSVSSALPSTTYQFDFLVRDPSTAVWTSSHQSYTTLPGQTEFSVIILFPSPQFNAAASTSLVGAYVVNVNEVNPIAAANVAPATFFLVGLTDKTLYQRTQTASIVATRYSPGESVTVQIRTSSTLRLVYNHVATASSAGVVSDSWYIPRNATVTESYILTLTGTTTTKNPADAQQFNVQPATMSIATLNSSKSAYQRTETLTFSFQPIYPSGQIANTGLALVRLTRPDRNNITLTTSYNSTSQTFVATYKTTTTNQTGTWTASLSSYGFDDGFGNTGPTTTLVNSPQLQPAALTISITMKTSFAPSEQIKFNATIQYPDGSAFQAVTGNSASSTLSFSGGGYTAAVPVVFDTALRLWVGSYSPTGNEPSGLWSLTVTASDSAQPPNSGSSVKAIQIQDRPPVATFTGSATTAFTGVAVSFDATSSSDPDGQITGYLWDFGDGSTGSGVTTSHSYSSPGTYTVRLTVTDNSGSTSSSTLTVTVQANPQSSGNVSFPLFYFGILAAIIAAMLAGGFLAFRRHRVTHAKLKIDLEAVKTEAGRIENQEFFQSVKDQLRKDKDD